MGKRIHVMVELTDEDNTLTTASAAKRLADTGFKIDKDYRVRLSGYTLVRGTIAPNKYEVLRVTTGVQGVWADGRISFA